LARNTGWPSATHVLKMRKFFWQFLAVTVFPFLLGGCSIRFNHLVAPSSAITSVSDSPAPESSPAPVQLSTLTVVPVFPNHGANWNDYVEGTADTSCTTVSLGIAACTHGGERKKVVLTGLDSCTGLSLADHLSGFNWQCDASSGTATFFPRD
jgi:hypothetical protein